MELGSWLLLKGALSICKFVGYHNCAKMAAMSFGKRFIKKAAVTGLESTGLLPMSLVRLAGGALGYAPTMVVFASGVVTNGVATTVSFVVLSQVTDYLFVVAIRTAVASGIRNTYNVVKYVLFSRNPSGKMKKINELPLQDLQQRNELEDGWVVVEEGEQVEQVIENEELVKQHLSEVEKLASLIDPEKVEYIELKQQEEGEEEQDVDEGFVVVQTDALR